jgi:hypothetical protein
MIRAETNAGARIAAPSGPDDITTSWLTAVLADAGSLKHGSVVGVRVEPLGTDRGLTGRVARLRLAYSASNLDAPTSVVTKFAAEPGATRDLADRFDLYEREANFYEHVSPVCPTPAPRLLFRSEPGTPFVLMLEDLERGIEVDLLRGCSLDQAAAVTSMLARTHARFWNDPALLEYGWLPAPNNRIILDLMDESSVSSWGMFKSAFGTHMPRDLVTLGNRISSDRTVLDRLSAPPWTLVHGDMRAHNIIFDATDESRCLAVIDWQTAMRARGPVDLASLFVTSLPIAERRIAERELLPEYHDALGKHGVRGYSYEECWRDYRLAAINQFSQVIALYALINVNSKIADDVAASTGERLVGAILDLDLRDFVPPSGLQDVIVSGLRARTPIALRRALRSLRK